MTKDLTMLFSVPPAPGQKVLRRHGVEYASQRDVAFVGRCRVFAERDEFWGGVQSVDYRGRLLTNPTWGQLYAEAKRAQRKTLDAHHVYFEGVYPAAVQNEPGVTQLLLALGS